MKNLSFSLVLIAAVLLIAAPGMAQHKRNSPHETISTVIDGNRVTVVYGRPYTKDPKTGEARKIWGGLIPWNKVWRTGADEATLLVTQKPLVIGGSVVPAGAYTLWTLPREDGSAILIINKEIGQWGMDSHEPSNAYDEKRDLVRIALQKDTVDQPVDQFTFTIDKGPSGGGRLKMAWDTAQFSVPFTVHQ